MAVSLSMDDRRALVRHGLWLNYATIGYNALEAIVSLVAGLLAGSVALVGFGVDSVIEVTAAGAAQWRLRADVDHARRERVERVTLRVIGWSFLALAAYVVYDSAAVRLSERTEQLRVSWYATAGSFSSESREALAGESSSTTQFRAPDRGGPVELWAVLRDDRGGVAWQSLTLTVE